jgi:hypothetical protein
MRYRCLYVLWLGPPYSWKSPLETAADVNFCDEALRLGAARTGVRFRLWPGCRGREPPRLQLARFPWSNRSYEESGNSQRGVLSYVRRGEERPFLRQG